MASAWLNHVKAVQKKKGISYKEAMTVAKATYKPTAKASKAKASTKAKPKAKAKKEKKEME